MNNKLELYLDDILEEKRTCMQKRSLLINRVTEVVAAFEDSESRVKAEKRKQGDIIKELTELKDALTGCNYQEDALDLKIKSVKDVLHGMNGGEAQ